MFGGEGVRLGGEVVFCHAVEEVADFVAESAGGEGVAGATSGQVGPGCDAFGVAGEQFADDDVLLGAGEEFEVAFYAAEQPAGLGSFEQVEA